MNSSLRRYLKKRIPYGIRKAAVQLHNECIVFHRHCREARKVPQFLRTLPIKLNLGCGPNRKNGWVNIDLFDYRADLQLDLRLPWPFPDDSVSYIYSEHVFEHFEFHTEVPHILGEALRVLEPGGVFDVAVPDTGPPLRAYGDLSAAFWSIAVAKGWHPGCQTQLERINHHFRQDGAHKYAWDAETLGMALETAGFTDIARRDFNPTVDSAERVLSLYMVAKKLTNTESETANIFGKSCASGVVAATDRQYTRP